MSAAAGEFAAIAVALYAAHHVGDYWVQTDHQARHKGDAGWGGVWACAKHCFTYWVTQTCFLVVTCAVLGITPTTGMDIGLLVSAGTHYLADRREHGVMLRLARLIPGKAAFLQLGRPRDPSVIEAWFDCSSCEGRGAGGGAADESTNGLCWDCRGGGKLPSVLTITDNPQLATGAWALDQAWHIFFGVFLAALLAVTL